MSAKLLAEFIGTFTLIFIGAGAGALGLGGLVGVALAHGLVVATFAYGYGPISGSHVNPAVTIGVLVAGEIPVGDAVAYIIAQLLGGIVAAFVLAFCLGGTETGLGVTTLATDLQINETTTITISALQGVVLEALMTFLLVNAVLNIAVAGRGGNMAGLAIGLTLALAILMAGPLTGASLNPARTIGPAIATGNFADIWVYIVGPVIGAVAAAGLYLGVFKGSES